MSELKVIEVVLTGGHYDRKGVYCPPTTKVILSDGTVGLVPDGGGFNGALDWVDEHGLVDGYRRHYRASTTEFRARLDVWVQTGQMPPVVA